MTQPFESISKITWRGQPLAAMVVPFMWRIFVCYFAIAMPLGAAITFVFLSLAPSSQPEDLYFQTFLSLVMALTLTLSSVLTIKWVTGKEFGGYLLLTASEGVCVNLTNARLLKIGLTLFSIILVTNIALGFLLATFSLVFDVAPLDISASGIWVSLFWVLWLMTRPIGDFYFATINTTNTPSESNSPEGNTALGNRIKTHISWRELKIYLWRSTTYLINFSLLLLRKVQDTVTETEAVKTNSISMKILRWITILLIYGACCLIWALFSEFLFGESVITYFGYSLIGALAIMEIKGDGPIIWFKRS